MQKTKDGKLYFDTPDNLGTTFSICSVMAYKCPFCGEENMVRVDEDDIDNHEGETVKCYVCGFEFWITAE